MLDGPRVLSGDRSLSAALIVACEVAPVPGPGMPTQRADMMQMKIYSTFCCLF